jgi:hypothetical protein
MGSSQPAEAKKWCAVTGGRGFMARHLVAALLRSGEWRVRVADLAQTIVLGREETEEVLGDGLRDGSAVYLQADVCNLHQLIQGELVYLLYFIVLKKILLYFIIMYSIRFFLLAFVDHISPSTFYCTHIIVCGDGCSSLTR